MENLSLKAWLISFSISSRSICIADFNSLKDWVILCCKHMPSFANQFIHRKIDLVIHLRAIGHIASETWVYKRLKSLLSFRCMYNQMKNHWIAMLAFNSFIISILVEPLYFLDNNSQWFCPQWTFANSCFAVCKIIRILGYGKWYIRLTFLH